MKGSRCGHVLALALLATVTLLAGCALQNPPPVAIYTIEPGWEQGDGAQGTKKRAAILQIAPVRGSAALTSTDILYSDTVHAQQGYAFSRWRDAPVRLMQTVLEVAVENSGLFVAVLPSTSVSGADFLLESTLLECGHILGEDGSSAGVIRMRFHLVENKSRKVVAGKELVAKIPAATLDAGGAVAAINQAAAQVVGDLVVWLEENSSGK